MNTTQINSCVRATEAMPSILPIMSWKGLTDDTIRLEHLVALLLDDSLHDHGAVHEYEHVYEQAEDVGGCHVQCAGGVPRLSGVGNLLGLEA